MNIFAIEHKPNSKQIDWIKSAQSHDDLRCVKMPLEATQMLCTSINTLVDKQITPYKSTHKNHPSTIWARQSFSNWFNLRTHAYALCHEYTRRFNKIHKAQLVLNELDTILVLTNFKSWFPTLEPTPLPLCMDNEYKIQGDPVQSYRLFYTSKPRMRYKRTNPPTWFSELRTLPYEHN